MKSADVAQLVEQLIRNEQVTGSIPAIGSKRRLEHGASQGANGSIFYEQKNSPEGLSFYLCRKRRIVAVVRMIEVSRITDAISIL